MDQQIINLYDEYTHKPLSRKVFIERLTKLVGSTALALSVLPLLEGNYANATQTENHNFIEEEIIYKSGDVDMKGLLCKPVVKKSKVGAVVVIHENRGLNLHIKDVAKRVANAGFLALAIDGLSPVGGTPANEDEARALFSKLIPQETTVHFKNGLAYLKTLENCNGKTGCVGFCWGGALANQLAVNDPQLNAAVAFYGMQPQAADVPKIKAQLQLHYAGLDERINAGIPAFETALKQAGVKHELFMYDDVNHAFHNDTSAARYNEKAAKLAWSRTITLFNKTLS